MTPNIFEMPKEKRAKYLKSLHKKANKKELVPVSPLMVQIGQNLKEKRLSRNLTQRELQELSGVDFAHIMKIEKGLLNVTVQTLYKLSEALGCRLAIEILRQKESNSTGIKPDTAGPQTVANSGGMISD